MAHFSVSWLSIRNQAFCFVSHKMANCLIFCRIIAKWPMRTRISGEKRVWRGLAILSGRNVRNVSSKVAPIILAKPRRLSVKRHLYWKISDHAPVHRRRRISGMVQLPLFDLESTDLAVGGEARGQSSPRPPLHLIQILE
jgi:hypothetical protein